MSDWIEVFGRLHPLVLHLPIGFIAALAALEVVVAARPQQASALRPAVSILAWLAAESAFLAVVTGYTLHLEDGYDDDVATVHMRLGIAVAIVAHVVAFVHKRTGATTRGPYRMTLAALCGLLIATGDYGSTLTRGPGFLMEPLRKRERVEQLAPTTTEATHTLTADDAAPAVAKDPASDTAVVDANEPVPPPTTPSIRYTNDIAPIFAAHCAACHGATKRKGGLALHTPDAVLAGGADGPVIVSGKPGESELVRRLRLPLDDEDHMPPEDKSQPTAEEVAKIEAWIEAGLAFD